MTSVKAEGERLQEFIRIHSVCYEVWPVMSYGTGEKRQVGFSIELCGTHDDSEHVSPGCHKCQVVSQHLAEVAAFVIPPEETSSSYPIQPFDHAIHFPPKRNMRSEVHVVLRIVHKHDYLSPLDECQSRCLSSITERLQELGVRAG